MAESLKGNSLSKEGTNTTEGDAYVFGSFKLVPKERALYESDRIVKIGGRAFDVLVALVENAGSVVTPHELIAKVWQDVVVDEANLRVHIASLRKVLRDGREGRRLIATSIGSGYTFTERVTRVQAASAAQPPPPPERRDPGFPRSSPMIGREGLETSIVDAMSRRRLVTLVGPGGIGKTSLAIAVAHQISSAYRDGALFVDLATISGTEHVLDSFAAALGMRAVSSAAELTRFLADREMLVVLDNCEHVIDAAAEIVGELFGRAPRLHIIATSREALRAEGEWVYRIPSLETPAPDAKLSADEALGFSSVALFVDRASAGGEPYKFTDDDAVPVCEICRRLDGIPLAIELAASRVELLGVAGLKSALETHLGFSLQGQRSAPPRHRTLRAVFDWSYATLSPFEQRTLRALSVFRGPFTLEGAAAVVLADAAEQPLLYDALAGLIEKSMVVTNPRGEDVRFRLLELTRAYGLEQLRASGELELALRGHATYCLAVCEDAERQLPTRPANAWIAAYRWRIDDVRAALSWSFGPSGDAAMGAALTVVSITLWLEVSAMDEFRQHVERALAYLREHPSTRAAEGEVRLKLALGVMIMHTAGPIPAMTQAIAEGLAVAEKLSPALHMEALGAMWIDGHARADYRTMLEMAERFAPYADATSDQVPKLIAARMMAWARHTHAQYDEGLRLAERVLAVPPPPRVTYGTQRVDGRVMMHTLIARTLWLTGRPESALREVRQGVGVALELRHAGTLCYALSLGACPVALWSGETVEASRYITQLIETASRTSLGFWLIWGRAFERVLRLSVGHGLRAGELGMGASLCDHLVTIRADLLDEPTEARIESGELGWAAPEVQRAKAVRAVSSGDIDGAEHLLLEALAASKQQGALSWELRIATTLAQLLRDRGDVREAQDLLVETMSRFVEGAMTTDHRNAAAVLASLKS
jgi:predicted ATPase/DNA-binding winged helix-turn-helix (wHTH) protein